MVSWIPSSLKPWPPMGSVFSWKAQSCDRPFFNLSSWVESWLWDVMPPHIYVREISLSCEITQSIEKERRNQCDGRLEENCPSGTCLIPLHCAVKCTNLSDTLGIKICLTLNYCLICPILFPLGKERERSWHIFTLWEKRRCWVLVFLKMDILQGKESLAFALQWAGKESVKKVSSQSSANTFKLWGILNSCFSSVLLLSWQDLTVTITSERPDTEIDIIPDENEMSGINVQTFVDQQVQPSVLRAETKLCCQVFKTLMKPGRKTWHSRSDKLYSISS